MLGYYIVGVLGSISFLYMLFLYGRFDDLHSAIRECWFELDRLFKERYSTSLLLLGNLGKYGPVTEEITQELNRSVIQGKNAITLNEQESAEALVSVSIRKLLAFSRDFPNLNTKKEFNDLVVIIGILENDIRQTIHHYNELILKYNRLLERPSGKRIAAIFNLKKTGTFNLEIPEPPATYKAAI